MFGNKKVNFEIRPLKKPRRQKKAINKNKFVPILKYAGIGAVTIILMFAVYMREQTGEWFKASVLEAPQPFNGTVPPVSKVPDWTHWAGTILQRCIPESMTRILSTFRTTTLQR